MMISSYGVSALSVFTAFLCKFMTYILFDAHNFYVSAELVFRPELRNKPVVVISSNDGCVISRSQAAKDIGIKMGEPAHFIREEFWRHNVKIFSANFPLYGDMSARMMTVIHSMAPQMTPYSIDEVLSCCDGMSESQLRCLAASIRDRVYQWTGLPIGAGIAPTKTLAKVASFIAKRVLRTDIVALLSREEIEKALRITPIAEVWGVGPAFASRLTAAGLKTAFDLANADAGLISQHFPVGLRRTQIELSGVDAVSLDEPDTPRQMINVGRSFGRRLSTSEDIASAFASFATIACEKLNRQRSVCGAVRVFLRPESTSVERTHAVTITLPIRTADPRAICSASVKAGVSLIRYGVRYSKGGICLIDLSTTGTELQGSLFDSHDVDGGRIATLIAGVNDRFGRGSIATARTLGSKRWMPRAESLSGSSTTDISRLPVVS